MRCHVNLYISGYTVPLSGKQCMEQCVSVRWFSHLCVQLPFHNLSTHVYARMCQYDCLQAYSLYVCRRLFDDNTQVQSISEWLAKMANGKWRDVIASSKEKEYTHRTGLGQRSVAPAL